jgi:uncharacterized protein (DUF58 family)
VDTLPPRISSFFVVAPGLCLVGLLLFVALLNGQRDLTVLSLLVLGMAGVAKLWARATRAGLRCRVALDRDRLFPGETARLTAEVENRRVLPALVEVAVPAQGLLPPGQRAAHGERGLLWYQTGTFRWELQALRRGVYQVGPGRMRSGDLLGFYASGRTAGEPAEVLVYPRIRPLVRPAVPRRDFFGIPGADSPVRDPVYILGTRDYQPGRPAKHIHWKASARHHRLQEKLFEPSEQEKVLLAVTVEGFAQAEAEAFEGTLEACASLAVRLDRAGVALGIAVDGVLVGAAAALVPVGRRPHQLQAILELLARLTSTPAAPLLDILGATLPWGLTCVCFSLEGARGAAVASLEHRRVPVLRVAARPSPEAGAHALDVMPAGGRG